MGEVQHTFLTEYDSTAVFYVKGAKEYVKRMICDKEMLGINYSAHITEECEEYVLAEIFSANIDAIISKYPNARAIGFVADNKLHSVDVVYSEVGDSGVTKREYVGDFDGHEEIQWQYVKSPLEKFRKRVYFENCGEYGWVKYTVPYKDDWEKPINV